MFNSTKQNANWKPAAGAGAFQILGRGRTTSLNSSSGSTNTNNTNNNKSNDADLEAYNLLRPAGAQVDSNENRNSNKRHQRHDSTRTTSTAALAALGSAGSQASFMTSSGTASGCDDDDDHDEESRLHSQRKQQQQKQQRHKAGDNGGGGLMRQLTRKHRHDDSSDPSSGGDGGGGGCDDITTNTNTNTNKTRKRRSLAQRWCNTRPGSLEDKLCLLVWRLACVASVLLVINAIVYLWPIAARLDVQPRVAGAKPRPKFTGPLATNNKLDELAESLFENQFHAPESMAWTANKRAFFTGVEGGFILLVEPYAERWTIAARLNARHSVEDKTRKAKFSSSSVAYADEVRKQEEKEEGGEAQPPAAAAAAAAATNKQLVDRFVPFCTRDTELYGPRAEFEPSLVRLSRCSRPLGIRLAPNETHLYVADPLSGLYRIELVPNLAEALASQTRPLAQMNRVSKLLDFYSEAAAGAAKPPVPTDQDAIMSSERPDRPEQVYFGDDIAVEWGAAVADTPNNSPDDQNTFHEQNSDVVYITDCSRRWTLRYLLWLMLENDDSGRVLRFEVNSSRLSQVEAVLPVQTGASLGMQQQGAGTGTGADPSSGGLDQRGLSFPNGLELTANKSALLISDLNNRRILMHHLRGPLAGQTNLVMWVPGYSDNIRRGLDSADGTPTYWFACGCAVADGKYEIAELANEFPFVRRLLLRWLHAIGSAWIQLGRWLNSTRIRDAGLLIHAGWLKVDPYCVHGLVAQFNEQGQILRSLHAPSFSSNYKLLSEAHQVPLLNFDNAHESSSDQQQQQQQNATTPNNNNNAARSHLYLGSVYYSYLGRLELAPHLPGGADP